MYNNKLKEDSLKLRVSQLGENFELSRNFKLGELQSKDGTDEVLIHPALLVLLQHLRDKFGRIRINSGYRSPSHNKSVGGSKNSTHTMGLASDIVPLDSTLEEVAEYIESLNPGGLKRYTTFIHVDCYGDSRRW